MTFFTGCVIRVARREASRAIMMVISPAVATTVAHWQHFCAYLPLRKAHPSYGAL